MTSQEFYVVVVLGLVGYWGTGAVIRHFKIKASKTEADKKFAQEQNSQEQQNQHDERRREEGQMSGGGLRWATVLDVNVHASLDEIKTAYKKKISMYHPDKVSALGPEFNEIAQEKSKEINAAYDEAIRSKVGH